MKVSEKRMTFKAAIFDWDGTITDSNHIDGEKYKAEGKVRQTFHCNLISCIFRSDKQSDNLVAEKGGEGEKTYSAEECCSVHQTEGLFDP